MIRQMRAEFAPLAYCRLRTLGENVPKKKLLGVIVDVLLQQGLDVLAAFSEGVVRYLNQSGKVAIFEGEQNPVEGLTKELVAVSQPVVNQIGPWDKQRLPPPVAGNVRMTFLVSDGLYFGEGPCARLATRSNGRADPCKSNTAASKGGRPVHEMSPNLGRISLCGDRRRQAGRQRD